MNFAPHTPESLLPRSDSKNPATTCKGITSTGRPCRRALASSHRSSPGPSPLKEQGVLAVLREEQDDGTAAAAFYCWQHKEQAQRVANAEKNHTELFPLQERTSIDTLVDRVGLVNLEENTRPEQEGRQRKKKRDGQPKKRRELPADWKRMDGPLMSVPSDMIPGRPKPQQPPRSPRSNIKASLFCCVRNADDDEHPPSRYRPLGPDKRVPATSPHAYQNAVVQPGPYLQTLPSTPSPASRKPVPSSPSRTAPASPGGRPMTTPTRPGLTATPKSSTSQTQGLLSFIPPHLSPQTTSVLLSELAKPISPSDAEGYIYMFWLTPESEASKPDEDAASDLLEVPRTRPEHKRRSSDVLQRYASQRRGPAAPKTILLKIGRAENVHRRLSQWAKQCSHNITLIRYYPYTSPRITSSSASLSPGLPQHGPPLPRKVPHVHRVERLIHVELAEKRVTEQGACENCGREHREWFELEASRDGLRAADEAIRRWVTWAEQSGY